MILPGKITICRLEEDIPAKSFFRIRPLLINSENGFEKAEGALAQFPDEGGIRIVPDRNEVARFKTRMRTLGSYCLLDLLRHTGENDKIRPNKNYAPDRGEMNRNIVYSDVITACPAGSIMEVLTPAVNEQGIYCSPEGTKPVTPYVLLRVDGAVKGPYKAERANDEEPWLFTEDSGHCLSEVPAESVYDIDLPGEGVVSIFIASSIMPAAPSEAKPAPAEAKPAPAEAKPAEAPAEAAPAVAAPEKAEAPEAEAPKAPAAEAPAEEAPKAEAPRAEAPKAEAPKAEAPKPQPAPAKPAPAKAEEPRKAPAPRPETRPEPEKPPRQMPQREFNRNAPMPRGGALNPRKGFSLAEYIDDSWKRTRFEQLGAGVAANAQSTPVLSPVEKTASAVRELLNVPEGRAALIKELGTDIFAPAAAQQPERDTHMDSLEAERLKLLTEIDSLKRNVQDTRARLMEEALHAHAAEAARMEEEKARLIREAEECRREADSARHALAESSKVLDAGARAKLDNEFLRFAMFSKAAQLLQDDSVDYSDFAGIPETCEPTAAQMVNELRARFEEAGRKLTNDEAVNLLVAAATGSMVIFSGAPGSGKTSLADSLAGALGLDTPGCRRYVKFGPDVKNARTESAFKAMMRNSGLNTQRFALLDDINALPCPDQARGLMSCADKSADASFTLFMTLQDDQVGYPAEPRLLDRSFVIRVKAPAFESWNRGVSTPKALRAPSLGSVKAAFADCSDVPAEVRNRMKVFIDRLNEIGITLSPRTLSDMYNYCAAACPLMSKPMRALDLAIAQRALPYICATAKLPQLKKLPELVCDLPECSAVFTYPLPLMPI